MTQADQAIQPVVALSSSVPAAEALRARIRAQSKTVADHIAADPEAKAFIDYWGWADRHR
ncbi:hypothetical protein [Synechococcus sp. UW140]|uniref:hypothetical protein n=1 Tax=Synechococcus sp. UW140 TaxID=368503 RepID=UPI003137F315